MLRALWFFCQLAIVVCAVLWLIAQRGVVDLSWNGYTINMQLGLFLLGFFLLVLLLVALFNVFSIIVDAPGNWSRRRADKNRQKGFQALTRGFVAIAAGDAKKATGYAKDVHRYLPNETGLPLLLEAQAARLRGDESSARVSFEKLLSDKDAAFFGIRGLLKSSLDSGDAQTALGYAKAALDKNPKQPWILKSVYDLELRNHHWSAASAILDRVKKYKAIDDAQARSDEIALLVLLSEDDSVAGLESAYIKKIERAVKLDPGFTPTVIRLCEYYLSKGKQGKVASLVEKAWKQNPHPDLAVLWGKVAPENKASDPLRRLRWFEKLVAFKPDSADGHIAAAKAAMEAGLAGEVRAHLSTAESIRPTSMVYRLWADLEETTTRNAHAIREWMDKAASAPADALWYCNQTGTIYDQWAPVAAPHGSFNTIVWGNPAARFGTAPDALYGWDDPMMIEKS